VNFLKPLIACAVLATTAHVAHAGAHMQDALKQLQDARASLQAASADKGGHRVKAIRAIDEAIAEVKAGMEFDREHESKREREGGPGKRQ